MAEVIFREDVARSPATLRVGKAVMPLVQFTTLVVQRELFSLDIPNDIH